MLGLSPRAATGQWAAGACLVLTALGCGARDSLPLGGSEGGGGVGAGVTGGAPSTGGSGGDGGGPCNPGDVFSCYDGAPATEGVGVCAAGERLCFADGSLGDCEGQVLPEPEACNGLDDDCDGIVDGPICDVNGCADGLREGFLDEAAFPDIAACAGGFQVPGVLGALSPTCDRAGGDDGGQPTGAGCSAEDLCSEGFTVCPSEDAVALLSQGACEAVTTQPGVFFVAGQSGTGCGTCANGTEVSPVCDQCSCEPGCAPVPNLANDLFGCGTVGTPTMGCGGLTRFSDDACSALPVPWTCGGGCAEATTVTKPGSGGGGVLCCRVGAF